MNSLFFSLILSGFLVTAWQQVTWVTGSSGDSPMQRLTQGIVETSAASVTLAIGLIGVMALFLGLMKVAEQGGLLTMIARLIRPLMVRLFPDVPADHPAMGAMILNIAANALGLGNAATPFGIRAMHELDRLNPHKGTASNSMALFLAINTSGITLLPTGVIALRASLGSQDPAAILPTTLFATFCSTLAAILAAKSYQKFFPLPPSDGIIPGNGVDSQEALPDSTAYPAWISWTAIGTLFSCVPLTIIYGKFLSPWVIPALVVGFLGFGVYRGVSIYETFVEGAREGFEVAVRIIPYLVAILVAVSMFRSSGALDFLVGILSSWTAPWGLPAEALPMALLRPLSGSGAYGLMVSVMQDPAFGPDSAVGLLVSTLQGSTETTFYVMAVYFGAIQIKRIRHTLAAALTADLVGVLAAVFICSYLF